MSNAFNKEEIVAFEEVLAGFQDALVMSKIVNVYSPDAAMMERTSDVFWRPVPYIATTQTRTIGTPVTASGRTQLSVPTTLGFARNDTFQLSATELRDALQEGRLGAASRQRLASDVNTDVVRVASLRGGIAVTRSTAAGTFDDVALCDTIMNERGVPLDDRHIVFNSRDYNGMAGNLANRANLVAGKTQTAYDRALIGDVAGFMAYKSDTGQRIRGVSITGRTIDTRASANNFYNPRATSTASTGERNNVDNRFQTITVSSNANFAEGDIFTIDGVTSVHHITKQDTGQLMTFRVVSVGSGNTLVITPPIISTQGAANDAAAQYQNCVVAGSGLATAGITVRNTTASGYNVFWHKPAIELITGRYAVPTDSGAAVMRGTTDQGLEVVMTKWFDTSTFQTRFTFDTLYGVNVLNPEMVGVLVFNQA